MFEDYEEKSSVVIVYTGEGKGKTTASIGLAVRALGNDMRVAYIQFIKHWEVSEHRFFKTVKKAYSKEFEFYKGGMGFYNAGEMSAKEVSEEDHLAAALETYEKALSYSNSGDFDVVVCDEINNAVNDGLLLKSDLKKLIETKHENTSLCLTGRHFPKDLLPLVDIATEMKKLKHHFDDKFLANVGIDY